MTHINKEALTQALASLDLDQLIQDIQGLGFLGAAMEDKDEDDPLNVVMLRLFNDEGFQSTMRAWAEKHGDNWEHSMYTFFSGLAIGLLTPVCITEGEA